MLDTVDAVRYIKVLSAGRNQPWLIEAERGDGEVVEVVAKLGSAECGPGGLIREAYCAMLAADLGLPVAEPFVVQLTPEFIDTLPDNERGRASGQNMAFGSTFVANLLPIQPGLSLPTSLRAEAASTFAFDAGVVNSDRLVTKPNCLTDGTSLLLIDHELCLNLHGRGFLMKEPWSNGALAHMAIDPSRHVFYQDLKPSRADSPRPDLSEICGLLGDIQPSRVREYHAAIPPEWDFDNLSSEISEFLEELITNAAGLRRQVDEVLS